MNARKLFFVQDRDPSIREQLALGNRYGLAPQSDTVFVHARAHDAAASRRLKADELVVLQSLGPEVRQAAMCGTGDRILVYSRGGGEESRHEVETWRRRP